MQELVLYNSFNTLCSYLILRIVLIQATGSAASMIQIQAARSTVRHHLPDLLSGLRHIRILFVKTAARCLCRLLVFAFPLAIILQLLLLAYKQANL
jgi:hypothetical protein